jgi:ATP-dependent 26S proteasome regulatory subunit
MIPKDLSNNIFFNNPKKIINIKNIFLNEDKKRLNTKIDSILNHMKKDKNNEINNNTIKNEIDEKFINLFKSIDNLSNEKLNNEENTNKKIFEQIEKIINKTEEEKNNKIVLYKNTRPSEEESVKERRDIIKIFESYGLEYNKKYYNPVFETTYNPFKINLKDSVKPIEKKKINIEAYIESLNDLLQLIEKYPLKDDIEYNINMKGLHNIKKPLIELKNMIGMNQLKNSVVDQIIYFIQDLHKCKNKDNDDFMHTVIYGPPGTGKTEIAKIIGRIFSKLGILKKNKFKKATRADMIAGYLGQTAIKTRDLMDECLGGVLFIDEAYALGNSEKRDSFAKECIDTLCEGLSDNKSNLMVIIAGYKEELDSCFFSYNQGLNSRFTWRFKTDDYNADELKQIFCKKVKDANWDVQEDISTSWFEKNKDYFKYYGRDMETLFAKTKIAHSRRIFGKDKELKKKINKEDLKKGLELYLKNDEVKNRKNDGRENYLLNTMYN